MTDIDISPEAVEQLARLDENGGTCDTQFVGYAATLRALSSALLQSRAETAAAYERAAVVADAQERVAHKRADSDDGVWDDGVVFGTEIGARIIAREIRALATPDQSSALAAVVAQAVADEREVCWETCDQIGRGLEENEYADESVGAFDSAAAIRRRGQA